MTQFKDAVDGSRGNGAARDVDALREEIRHTRAELGETVQALAAKMDVKARVRESAAHTVGQVKDSAGHAVQRARQSLARPGETARRPAPWAAAALAGAALVVALVVLRARRHREGHR